MYRIYTEFRALLERILGSDFLTFRFMERDSLFSLSLQTTSGDVYKFQVEDEEELGHLDEQQAVIWKHVYDLYEQLKDYSDFSIETLLVSDVDNQVQIEIVPLISTLKQKFEIKGKPVTLTSSMVEGILQHTLSWKSWRREDRSYTIFCSADKEENFRPLGTVQDHSFVYREIVRGKTYSYYIVETTQEGIESVRTPIVKAKV